MSVLTRLKLLSAIAVVFGLLAANIYTASAHQWWVWHWNKGGTYVDIKNWNYASNYNAAEAARQDGWNKIGILYNYNMSSHTDVSVFDGYWDTSWAGLASIEEYTSDWYCCWYNHYHIQHVHARYNTKYPMNQAEIQGIFCQEIGHAWGLDHSDTGDCMGMSYYNWNFYYGSHNVNDFYSMYRYHSH